MIKIIYAGSPDAAAQTLQILFDRSSECGFEIAGVISNPPTAKGRHKELTPTPVAALAQQLGLPVCTPEHLDAQAREWVSQTGADLLVCFAYGHIFGPKFLSCFKLGGMNLHPSLLPKYRGCTPVPAAILNLDSQTAVTIQTLGLKMDEGDILSQEIVNLDGSETGESLLNYAAKSGANLICELLNQTSKDGKVPQGKPQEGEASYTSIITKEDGKIDWSMSAESLCAKIRAYYPDPGCWTMEKGQPLRILNAGFLAESDSKCKEFENEPSGKVISFCKPEGIYIKTGKGILVVKELQRQGKKAMMYKDFMNGAKDFIGTVLE